MKEIPLTKGKVALVDDDDYPHLLKFKWHANRSARCHTWYAETTIRYRQWEVLRTSIHRLVLGARRGEEVDHIDGNGLNNQKSNLRFATRAQQSQNRRAHAKTKSGYKGVCPESGCSTWRAYIIVRGKEVRLGNFPTKEQAAEAYNAAATKFFGEFAYLNVIRNPEVSQSA